MNILVTGANRGLGLALIKTGLEKGHQMYAGVRNLLASPREHLEELQKMYEEKLQIIEIDVTNENSVKQAAAQMKDFTESLDVIINNAGILNAREERIEELDIAACQTAFDSNTLGPLRVVKHFLPFVREGEKQSIINISSDSASLTNAYSNDYPYGLSKAALNMFSEKLKVYLHEEDVQVLSIHPGWMKTDMGGENAPVNPIDSANNIFKLIKQRETIANRHAFIDHKGISMEL